VRPATLSARLSLLSLSLLPSASAQVTSNRKPAPAALTEYGVRTFEVSPSDAVRHVALSFFNDSQEKIATIEFPKQGELYRVSFASGEMDWVRLEATKQDREIILAYTNSKGLRLVNRIITAAGRIDGDKLPVQALIVDEGAGPERFDDFRSGLSSLRAYEKRFFSGRPLEFLHSVLRLLPEFSPLSNLPSVEFKPAFFECRVTCFRLVVLTPLFACADNALPDVCPCPNGNGYFVIWSCAYNWTCLVDCSAFIGGIPADD
jgi:hypothetical protein